MATIKFRGGAGSGDFNNAIKYMTTFFGPLAGSGQSVSISAWSQTSSRINIYKGAIGNFSTLTNVTDRNSDLLISFSGSNTSISNIGNVTVNGIVYYRFTLPAPTSTTASASGTASWFLAYNNASTSLDQTPAMIGTVGVGGSDADLIISTTSIISGQTYTCGSLTMSFPIEWSI